MTIDAQTLKELVMSGEYNDLTVREFVKLIEEAEEAISDEEEAYNKASFNKGELI